MTKGVKLTDLKKMISLAEDELQKLKDDDRRHLKQRRITRALNKTYEMLDTKEYTQDDVDKHERMIWRSLQDRALIIWLLLFGIFLSGAIMFASYETYSFFRWNWDREHPVNPQDPNTKESLVYVRYKESNIVSLYNLMPVRDLDGLNNPKQEFSVSNDEDKMPTNVDYTVKYNVNILELNDQKMKLINKKYIRYQLTHYDSVTKEKVTEPIGKLSDLKGPNPDGTYTIYTGTQAKGAKTNFEVVFWLGEDAENDQMGRSYKFAFRVAAAVAINS